MHLKTLLFFFFITLQALILGFVAENSISHTMAYDKAKGLAKDPEALAELSMDRTSASYKLNHGVKKTIQERSAGGNKKCLLLPQH